MNIKKWLLSVVVLVLIILSACSDNETTSDKEAGQSDPSDNFNETGFPIVDEQITLDIFNGKAATTADDWNDVMIWNEYREMTNIDAKWQMIPFDGLEEKRNLAFASGNLPDVFHTALIPTNDLQKYGEQGVFIPLNDLIEEHAPNFNKILEENPEIKKGITFPDGNIYSLPAIYSPDFKSVLVSTKMWIKQDWLDALGMEMPETTEEFYQYLKAVKEQDPNGNGEADEIPFGDYSGIVGLSAWLKGAWGLGNRGTNHPYIDVDPDTDEMRFYHITDEYRELLEYIHKLYSEELIQQNIFSVEPNQVFATGSDGLYGSTEMSSTETLFGGDGGKGFVGLTALEGPHGDRMLTKYRAPIGSMGAFAITSENEYPEATIRWIDYFYSDEGAELFFMGKEGETYEKTEDGDLQYMDHITNSAEGLSMEQELAKYLTWLGGGYPGILKQDLFNGAESLPSSIEATEQVEPYIIEEVWPVFTYTNEENQRLNALATDIEKYADEMRDKFVTGDTPFSEWENYVETIKSMGLDEYMEIKQAAYERYKN